jgi:hypothetical protein
VKDDKNGVIYNYCKKSGRVKANYFKLLKKNQSQVGVNSGGTRNGIARAMAYVVLIPIEKNNFKHELWISDSDVFCHYCNKQ